MPGAHSQVFSILVQVFSSSTPSLPFGFILETLLSNYGTLVPTEPQPAQVCIIVQVFSSSTPS